MGTVKMPLCLGACQTKAWSKYSHYWPISLRFSYACGPLQGYQSEVSLVSDVIQTFDLSRHKLANHCNEKSAKSLCRGAPFLSVDDSLLKLLLQEYIEGAIISIILPIQLIRCRMCVLLCSYLYGKL